MAKKIYLDRSSVGPSLGMAVAVFVLAFMAAVIVLQPVYILVIDYGLLDAVSSLGGTVGKVLTGLMIALLVALPFLLAYGLARLVYRTLHWKTLPDDTYCRSCGYNLTGNVSGRCPECGTEVARPCHNCGYDLGDNTTGRCPECGQPVRLSAASGQALPRDGAPSLPDHPSDR